MGNVGNESAWSEQIGAKLEEMVAITERALEARDRIILRVAGEKDAALKMAEELNEEVLRLLEENSRLRSEVGTLERTVEDRNNEISELAGMTQG